jgi:hypothetical protein
MSRRDMGYKAGGQAIYPSILAWVEFSGFLLRLPSKNSPASQREP